MIQLLRFECLHLAHFSFLLADPFFGPEALDISGVFFAKEVLQHLHALPTSRHGCDFTYRVANVTEDIGGML